MGKPAWVGLACAIVLAFICAGIYAFTIRGGLAEATLSEVNTIVGVDVDTTGNSATTLGDIDREIDRCISVNSDDVFYIDLFVKDVTGLNKWEGTFSFDGSLVEVNDLSVNDFFLGSSPWKVFQCYPDKCTTGTFDTGGVTYSGEGVLGRLKLTALAPGVSKLYFTIWREFGVSGVILEDASDPRAPIGDLDGDDYFDGLVFNAIVVVDGPCEPDPDRDGFTNAEESVDGSDLLDVNSTPETCDSVDNDLDGLTDEWYDRDPVNTIPDCSDSASNTDGDEWFNPTDTDDDNDGWVDAEGPVGGKADEAYLATDSLADCAVNEYHNAWPLDINNNRDLGVTDDVYSFRGMVGAKYGDSNFRKRLDFNANGDIGVTDDVYMYRGHIADKCTV